MKIYLYSNENCKPSTTSYKFPTFFLTSQPQAIIYNIELQFKIKKNNTKSIMNLYVV